ncbi:MAG: nitrile hydratase accessory protein [Proteobacteria bacterium]|nr:nitrile hydratase accessory protein [Pseudomonadota bacterium]
MTPDMLALDPTLESIDIPRDEEGPVFEEPWQAQAFALTVKLNEAGQFTWSEWAEIFGAEIATATSKGEGCGNNAYYLCWLAALEKIVSHKNLLTVEQLAGRKEEWRYASEHTEHGQPIELK